MIGARRSDSRLVGRGGFRFDSFGSGGFGGRGREDEDEDEAMGILLLMTILVPLALSFWLALMSGSESGSEPGAGRRLALGTSLGTLAAACALAASHDPSNPEAQFLFRATWMEIAQGGRIEFAFGLDGLSLGMFVLTPLLTAAAILSGWNTPRERSSLFHGLLLAAQAGLSGAFAAQDVVLFYVFFELTLIPAFLLIGMWGGPDRRGATIQFFIYTLFGSLLTLVGLVALVVINYNHGEARVLTFSMAELTRQLGAMEWGPWRESGTIWNPSVQGLVFALLLMGFAVKLPLFPFHSWLPGAYHEAPTPATIVMAGAMSKLGAYGLLRIALGMTPQGLAEFQPLVSSLAVAGILYGALNAMAQTNMKLLVAYSSFSHMGFIALGVVSLNGTGIDGATAQMVNHAITTTALFAIVGAARERYGTHDLEAVGGLWTRMPLLAFFAILAALGSAGVPGLNGFVGEFPILAGAFRTNPWIGFLGTLGMILGAWYLIGMLSSAIFGPATRRVKEVDAPIRWTEIASLGTLSALIVALGVRPEIMFRSIRPSAAPLAAAVERARVTSTIPIEARPDADADADAESEAGSEAEPDAAAAAGNGNPASIGAGSAVEVGAAPGSASDPVVAGRRGLDSV